MNPKKRKLFYGWWIVVAVFFIQAYISGILYYSFTALFEPITADFGWSYAQIAFAASIRGLEASFLAPLVGWLFDRFGPRKLMCAGAVVTGLSLVLLGRINSLTTFYGAFILMAAGMSTLVGSVIPMAALGNWFRRRLTLAIGIVVCANSLGGLMVPLVTQIIDAFGWRSAMAVFGIVAWALLFPLSLVVRHKPENYGYLPDGDTHVRPVTGESLAPVQDTEAEIGVSQALGSRIFWHISLGLGCHLFVINAVVTHIMPYLSSIGMSRPIASLAASGIPVLSILGRLSFGWFGDRFDKRRVTALGFAALSLSMLLVSLAGNMGTGLLILFLVLFGIGYGGPVPLVPALLREYFGRFRLGTMLGLSMGLGAIFGVVGPPLAGWIFDSFGNYSSAWIISTILAIIGGVLLATAPSFDKFMASVNKRGSRGNPI